MLAYQKLIRSNLLPKFYLVWAVPVIAITFFKENFNNDAVTHLVIIGILALSLVIFKSIRPKNHKLFFIVSCVILAALGEGAYMITKPVLPFLLVGKNTTFGEFSYKYLIDLLFTVPVYFLIFWVIWRLINTFNYSKWEYIFLMGLGQAIGDGSSFFFARPGALLFLPYIMLNYHAMNVAPFLCIQNYLIDTPKSDSPWKYPLTVLILFATYFLGGTLIKIVAKIVAWG